MFSKILIANRGEIACRVIRTARRMGIATVAVYSAADRDALHVRMADEAVAIGPAPASQSYLSVEAIIAACKQTGAEAVHPGYGFLSERAAFVEALLAAGITFIGPNAAAIGAMGDKIESKKAAAAAGVRTVPGFLGVIESPAHAVAIADGIGYPVMIKASAGGGGKGMRIAQSAAEVADGFARAKSEAAASFGDDRVFIEKFIENPRHIEIQVLGDKHGTVIHLGERECSIQRRHQKVLEEAPSPLLDEATRTEMGAQAIALARAVAYDSAGTVEFVAAQDRSFYFLEMNTRLQVEHPVTELVTGIDIVEEMIRVAAGERLRIAQADVTMNGWAVEARIYAEDPVRGFQPSTGRVLPFRPPEEGLHNGVTVRVDTGLVEGDAVSIYYDPMIAKLITHAPTRAGAIAAQARALDQFAIGGIRHNLAFLSSLMGLDRWQAGQLSTGLIVEAFGETIPEPLPEGELARRLVAIVAANQHRADRARHARPGRAAMTGSQARVVVMAGEAWPVTTAGTDAVTVTFADGLSLSVASAWRAPDPIWSGTVGGSAMDLQMTRAGAGWALRHAGKVATFEVWAPRAWDLSRFMPHVASADTDSLLLSPMPGLLTKLLVQAGDAVAEDQPLAVIEAMKMETVLRSRKAGLVGAIYPKIGDTLAVDAPILKVV
ncbi:acetyl/propionyl/methylcrotonyl-CoA carboxylase subunit alpha [Acidisoma cellulosilytica]|uniref:propionyl-CoA carboxylase n=2 Tax=Acidisoma cellulosilyticum TaxID=2802395 RepID=A0A964E5M7_9PROT|nr:acetyl/propionyl/methylcrotonyl-CoA carboxylase subunit alpha [Acidisoma cellulosilyticum]MCB8882138.1 acetyl/propionyl/methylcrotonyl-CoA carboxylase subunit alpha [Acidisoma cellulosilyticum]